MLNRNSLILTNDFEVDPGVSGGRLSEVDAAAVGAAVLLAQVVDPEDGRGRGVVLEARAGAQVHAVVPVPADLHPVAANVVAEGEVDDILKRSDWPFEHDFGGALISIEHSISHIWTPISVVSGIKSCCSIFWPRSRIDTPT